MRICFPPLLILSLIVANGPGLLWWFGLTGIVVAGILILLSLTASWSPPVRPQGSLDQPSLRQLATTAEWPPRLISALGYGTAAVAVVYVVSRLVEHWR